MEKIIVALLIAGGGYYLGYLLEGVILGVIVFGILFYMESKKNISAIKEEAEASKANIDVILQKRHDLLVKLIDVLKIELKEKDKDRDTIKEMIAAVQKNDPFKKSVFDFKKNDQFKWFNDAKGLISQMTNLLSDVSSPDYNSLKNEIVRIENELSAARRYYNFSVKKYNSLVNQKFFGIKLSKNEPLDYFEVDEEIKKDIKVSVE